MSAEGGLTTTAYIQHHLTNLAVCSDAAKDAAGHCQGFWTFHLDTLLVSGILGLVVFGLMGSTLGVEAGGDTVPVRQAAAREDAAPAREQGREPGRHLVRLAAAPQGILPVPLPLEGRRALHQLAEIPPDPVKHLPASRD